MSNSPFGRDLASFATGGSVDLDPSMAEATGLDVLVQSLVRRHVTPTGSAILYPNDGVDVRSYIKAGMNVQDISQICGTVQTQLRRDQRVIDCSVTGTFDSATDTLTLTEKILANVVGPFTLTLAISQVSVLVIVSSQ